LAGRVAALYPTEAFVRRLPAVDSARVTDDLRKIAPLLGHGSPVIGVPFEDLTGVGTDPAQVAELKRVHAELSRLASLLPGLGLAATMEDPQLAPEKKTEIVGRRAGLVGAIATKYPDKELLSLDFAPDGDDIAALNLGSLGLSQDEQG